MDDLEFYRLVAAAFLGVVGLVVGSFLNVCIYRLPNEESVVNPPSHCPKCNTRLRGQDMVPVLSWLFLRGKCRYCGEKVSAQYAIVELATSALFVGVFLASGDWTPTFPTIMDIIFCTALLGAFVADLNTYLLPDEFTIVAGLAAFAREIGLWFTAPEKVTQLITIQTGGAEFQLPISALGGAVLAAVSFWLLGILATKVFKKDALGFGDVKLMLALGARVGATWALLAMSLLAVLVGAVLSVLFMSTGKMKRDSIIPFGPFLAGAGIMMVFLGDEITKVFMQLYGLE